MPTYTVNDPTSGKTIKITGDSPPSEEELNQIFAAAGNQSQPGMLQKVGSAAEGVSNFLFPATTQAVKGAIKDPNSLNKEFETPMSVPAKVLGGVASVMTPGSGAAVMRQNTPLGSAGREMLTNIVGGELLGAGVNKAGEIAAPLVEQVGSRLAESALGEFGQRLAQKAVSKVANISGKEFTDFEIATQGKNLIDTMYKYLQKVPGSDKLRALYGKAGKDGILDSEMKSAESVIQKRIAQEGPDAIAYIDELLQPIDDLLEKVATKNVDAQTGKVTYEALPGQDQIVEALKSFSDKTRSRFVDKGLTAKNVLEIKRAGDANLGASVVNEDAGAVLSRVRKIVTNQARDILKAKYPDIAQALETEQEIYHLMPIVKDQLGKIATDKNFIPKSISSVQPLNPFTYPKAILENNWVMQQASQGKLPLPGLEMGVNILKKVVTSPLVQRGVVVPQVVKTITGGGGAPRPGLNIPPKYLYR